MYKTVSPFLLDLYLFYVLLMMFLSAVFRTHFSYNPYFPAPDVIWSSE